MKHSSNEFVGSPNKIKIDPNRRRQPKDWVKGEQSPHVSTNTAVQADGVFGAGSERSQTVRGRCIFILPCGLYFMRTYLPPTLFLECGQRILKEEFI